MSVCHQPVPWCVGVHVHQSLAYLDQGSNVLVLNSTLSAQLVEATSVGTVSHALILQVALATLVADGAVEGVVGEQELHDALAGLVNERGVGLDDHAGLDGPGARGDGLGCSLDLDQTHTTIAGNHELLVVAVAGDSGAGLLAGLNEGGSGCRRRGLLVEGHSGGHTQTSVHTLY